jgi:hypothetical protein
MLVLIKGNSPFLSPSWKVIAADLTQADPLDRVQESLPFIFHGQKS